jgi:hypothetical protein
LVSRPARMASKTAVDNFASNSGQASRHPGFAACSNRASPLVAPGMGTRSSLGAQAGREPGDPAGPPRRPVCSVSGEGKMRSSREAVVPACPAATALPGCPSPVNQKPLLRPSTANTGKWGLRATKPSALRPCRFSSIPHRRRPFHPKDAQRTMRDDPPPMPPPAPLPPTAASDRPSSRPARRAWPGTAPRSPAASVPAPPRPRR